MAIKTDIRGMVHEYHDYFVVGREKVREFATAIKDFEPASHDEAAAAELGHQALVAPLTFVSTFALTMQKDFFRKVDTGFDTMQIVQVDQRFKYHKPLLAGDKVWGRMEVISVDERFGADIVVTRNLALDENGELYLEAFTTLMGHEGDNSISLKYDRETGQVVRTAPPVQPDTDDPAAESD
ncbi:(3R)-hydroxyacyl-ACP dehydratase subunit HadC [Mycobacterium sp. 1274761.0]|uniref:(3R)-hydroxyacyl-ACP dehydratase subunit HadC n=1 Tax=Mycobacterium sp. 1274761.0 TaxID=1834077 RepID=UPI0007FECAEB|nr:(3R)-hydroxyacyl-ACP dehydratase subunit HadC [Mycobacterium sp. 1274761.0]OBK70943.1 3-hydroxyacyl-ACP dehydratase [Mycobacterium sp. 1274761.0]